MFNIFFLIFAIDTVL